MRRYAGKWHRFVQPDPSEGSYDMSNPQSFNRYAYVQNDPVNFVDPLGLDPEGALGGQLAGVATIGPGTSYVDVFIGESYGGFLDGGGDVTMVIDPERRRTEGVNPQNAGQPFLTDALEEAKRRLQNADCAKLFGGVKNALKKLGELKLKFGTVERDIAEIKGKNVQLDSGRFTSQGADLAFVTNIIESTTPGYTSTKFTLKRLIVTGSTFGAFVLLHELGHRTKIYGKYDKDAGSQFDNLATGANNEKIRAACFSELEPY